MNFLVFSFYGPCIVARGRRGRRPQQSATPQAIEELSLVSQPPTNKLCSTTARGP